LEDLILDTRKITKEYRISHWSQIIQERNESGLSIKAYCEKVGIHQNVYHYWQRRLREAAIMASGHEETITEINLPVPVPDGWAVCESKDMANAQSTIQIEIGNSRISASESTNPELLEKVCKVLMSLC